MQGGNSAVPLFQMIETDETSLEKRILLSGGGIIAVNKIPGEAMEGAGGSAIDLPRLLAEHLRAAGPEGSAHKNEIPPTAVHRLDIPVSGCALFALDRAALSFLGDAFARREGSAGLEKVYWAIVEKPKKGAAHSQSALQTPANEGAELIHWIESGAKGGKSFAFAEPAPGRKKAVLRYRVKGEGEHYFFVEVELATGRHHQIRAQFAALGLHIKGDLKYGAARSEKNGGIRLHARSLCFPAPPSYPARPGSSIRLAAPPPLMDRLWHDASEALTKP